MPQQKVLFALLVFALAFTPAANAQQSPAGIVLDVDNAANLPGLFSAPEIPATNDPRGLRSEIVLGPKLLDATRAVSPGEIVTVSLSGPTIQTTVTPSSDGVCPTDRDGFTVMVGATRTGICSDAGINGDPNLPGVALQVTFQIPFNIDASAAAAQANIRIAGNGYDVTITSPILPSVARLYGHYLGSAEIRDGQTWVVNDNDHPLVTQFFPSYGFGSLVAIYCVGCGALSQSLPVGMPAMVANPLINTASVVVNLVAADGVTRTSLPVLYAGAQPLQVGMYSVVAFLPTTAGTGFLQAELVVNGDVDSFQIVR